MKNSRSNSRLGYGNYIGSEKTDTGLRLKTDTGLIEITVYNPNVVRIRLFNPSETSTDFSYAVISSPDKVSFKVVETESLIQITTSALKLKIQKQPLLFGFYDLVNEALSIDDPMGMSRIGNQIAAYKKLQDDERFIGLGEKTGNLDRRGSEYVLWNTDAFAYGINTDPIYMSIPFYIGLHHQKAYGIFFDNTHKAKVNFGASNNRYSSFSAEGGDLNYYFIHDTGVKQIIQHYTWLTGRIEMPPMWSLGFQQCRYSYYPDKKVLNVAQSFREKKIPADVIYLDIHYMDEFKVFSFDKERFSKPEKMVEELQDMNFETVVILDPGIKTEEGYSPYDEGMKNDYFIKYPDGEPYAGQVWPGWSHFPDFTKPEVRKWWGNKLKFYTDKGINGYWNDMNEPAVWGQSVPDIVEFDYEGEGANSIKAHNIYGMQMCRSTTEGYQENVKDRRPFVLNRAGYSGIQRYGATWTGDNVATDEHLLCGVRLVNSLGLSGVPFSGYDIGGFAGEAGADLFAKWISLGAFTPLFRGHSMINTKDSEPWSYGEEVEEISRNYIGLRYRLMPYIYSSFYESAQTGLPIARSLAIEHSHDSEVYNPAYQNQYYFGDAFLPTPVESTKELFRVYLPDGIWYDMHSGKLVASGNGIAMSRKERLPIFIKGSSIIPMQSLVQSTKEKHDGTLEIHVYKGESENSFNLYEDDGDSYKYQKGEYLLRAITYNPGAKKITIDKGEGSYSSSFKKIKLYLHSFNAGERYQFNGKDISATQSDYQFIEPVSCFDPFYQDKRDDMIENSIPVLEFKYEKGEMIITW